MRYLILAVLALAACEAPDRLETNVCESDPGYTAGYGSLGFECCPTATPEHCAPELDCMPDGETFTCQYPDGWPHKP